LVNLFEQKEPSTQEDFSMRETHLPQASIFNFYSEYEFGNLLGHVSMTLNEHAEFVLPLIEKNPDRPIDPTGGSLKNMMGVLSIVVFWYIQCTY
jgi:hypothetical protein